MVVNNFEQIEQFMNFSDSPCYYKFCILVRNKDGKSPLVHSDSKSAETLIKSWYVDSKEYYEKVKSEMIALAECTRGRLYMTLDRKDTRKTIVQLFTKISEIITAIVHNDNVAIKRLNKIMSSVTSSELSSDKDEKTLLYDIDCKDDCVLVGVRAYVLKYSNIMELETKDGYHIVTKRDYKIEDNWQDEVANYAMDYMKLKQGKLTTNEVSDIISKVKDIRVCQNQLGLVYYRER